jgi:hypothetical protein
MLPQKAQKLESAMEKVTAVHPTIRRALDGFEPFSSPYAEMKTALEL